MGTYLRYFLLPFSWLYGLGLRMRHALYDHGIWRSMQYNMPIIVVGNLAVGGAGKSPMTEYLIQLLAPHYKVATLSRGYGRKTRGFKCVETDSEVGDVGDEPLQFKSKFPDITVAVCEDRVQGISHLRKEHDVIILDDAFQHRALTPGLGVLLFEYESLNKPVFLLPAGNFRDLFSRRKYAKAMIVTKVPRLLSKQEKLKICQRLKPSENQWILFSYLKYGDPYLLEGTEATVRLDEATQVLLLVGIANPEPLIRELRDRGKSLEIMAFPDHHAFTPDDLKKIGHRFHQLPADNKIILTTEKDAQRLKADQFQPFLKKMPVWVLPVQMDFEPRDHAIFQKKILEYCERSRKRYF